MSRSEAGVGGLGVEGHLRTSARMSPHLNFKKKIIFSKKKQKNKKFVFDMVYFFF